MYGKYMRRRRRKRHHCQDGIWNGRVRKDLQICLLQRLSLVSRYFYHTKLFHPSCFERISTSSHSFGRKVDKQTSCLLFDFKDDLVILNVNGLVVYAGVSRHARQFAGKQHVGQFIEEDFDINFRFVGIGFIATQGHKFLFCGCKTVKVIETKEAKALASWSLRSFVYGCSGLALDLSNIMVFSTLDISILVQD